MKLSTRKKILRIALWSIFSPIFLFLLLATALYLPPVQQWAVNNLSRYLSEKTGVHIEVTEVRLSFPLDFKATDIQAIDNQKDTLLTAKELHLNIALRPLLNGEAHVDGIRLSKAWVNTKGLISDCQISGNIGWLSANAPGINWKKGHVPLKDVSIKQSNLYVLLTDTAQQDTTKTPTKWNFDFNQIAITQSSFLLSLPHDSIHIGTILPKAELRDGQINLAKKLYTIKHILLKEGTVVYDVPQPKDYPLPLATLRQRIIPQPIGVLKTQNLDTDHLHFTRLNTRIKSLRYDSLGKLTFHLLNLTAQERSGLVIREGKTFLEMTKSDLLLNDLQLHTDNSTLHGKIGLGLNQTPRYQVTLQGNLGNKDMRILGGFFLTPQQRKAYPRKPLFVDLDIEGTLTHLTFHKGNFRMPQVLTLSTKGWVKNINTPYRSGSFTLQTTTGNVSPLFRFIGQDLDKTLSIPPGTKAQGLISFKGNQYATDMHITVLQGMAHIKGDVNVQTESYHATVSGQNFPIHRFLPNFNGTSFSGSATLNGRGFEVLSSRAYLDSKIHINQFSFAGYDLSGFSFNGRVTGSSAKGHFAINNPMVEGEGMTDVQIGKRIDLMLDATFTRIEAHRLGLTKETTTMGGTFSITAHTDRQLTVYGLHGTIDNAFATTSTRGSSLEDMSIDLESSPKQTEGRATAGDLELSFTTKGSIPMIADRLQRLISTYEREIVKGNVSQEMIKRELPMGTLFIRCGSRNPLSGYCRLQGYEWQSLVFDATISPIDGINGTGYTSGLQLKNLQIDTTYLHLLTDSAGLKASAFVENYKKRNPNRFSLRAQAYLLDDGGGADIEFKDADGKIGVKLGAEGRFEEGSFRLHLFPTTPILAYRKFTINEDNYIALSRNNFWSASVNLLADDGTGLKVYGEPSDSLTDLTVSIQDLNLDELTNTIPILPSLQGKLSGDLHWEDNHTEQSFMLDLNSKSLAYEGMQLGNISVQGVLLPKTGNTFLASAFLSIDSTESMTFNGTYVNEQEGNLEGEITLENFASQTLNGFLAGTDVMLDGIANGALSIKGNLSSPIINGDLDLKNTRIYSKVYGFSFKADSRPLTFENSQIIFDHYRLSSGTEEALTLNGDVSLTNLSNPSINLDIQAKNFELVNTKKQKESLIYGKVYSDFNGQLRGTTNRLRLRGNLSLLPTTNMTYILKDSPLNTDDRLKGLVEFTSFTDTTATENIPIAQENSMDITLGISIDDAAKFHCDLSTDGKSYIDIHGGGNLTFRMTQQGDMRLTGRYTINEGTMEYEMPIIPLKKFTINPGSSLTFSGNPMNPTLNITATEKTKAIVTDDDTQHSVTFNTGLVITQTLENMGLSFTIEAPNDLSVSNELNAMDKEERSKVAVAMLATGMYLTNNSIAKGTGFKTSSALNAFLQSEIQQIAGNALKTVDISVGVESGTSAIGTTTTDYAFQFSKRFFNDRLSVSIGGRVSTGADAVNNGTSIIDNISIQYRLDQGGMRYVQLFYDRNTRDPFEGQITQAGAGLVLKKKVDRLSELFLFRRQKK